MTLNPFRPKVSAARPSTDNAESVATRKADGPGPDAALDWHESAWLLRTGLEVTEIESVPGTGWGDDPITVPADLA